MFVKYQPWIGFIVGLVAVVIFARAALFPISVKAASCTTTSKGYTPDHWCAFEKIRTYFAQNL